MFSNSVSREEIKSTEFSSGRMRRESLERFLVPYPYWSMDGFESRHDPIVVGCLPCDLSMFDQRHFALRILDMPIKFPWSDVRVPDYAQRFLPFISFVEETVGSLGDDRFLYLTVDQGLVKSGTTQRTGGCHVDGMQGERISPKVAPDFSFIISDAIPTVFYKQKWNVSGLDVLHDNVFLHFDAQANPDSIWRPSSGEIVACNAWTVHRADYAPVDTFRTFCRLSYSVREFDRAGNNINPEFPYQWDYHSRSISKTLRGPSND